MTQKQFAHQVARYEDLCVMLFGKDYFILIPSWKEQKIMISVNLASLDLDIEETELREIFQPRVLSFINNKCFMHI